MINAIIVSPQVLLRQGIEFALSSVPDIKVLESTDFSNGVLYSCDDMPPEVAILDVDSPDDAGFDLLQTIKQRLPNVATVVLSSNTGDEQIFRALKAQAGAFLSKEVAAETIIDTVRRVAHGEYPINESLHTRPKVAEHVLHQFQELLSNTEAESFISPLTTRETEILEYIARGFLNKQIAAELQISEQTIKNHVTSILRKLNANARTEAVVIALKQGIISLD